MKSPSGSVTLRRMKEGLMMKAVSPPAEVRTVPAEVRSVPAGVRHKESQDAAHPPPRHDASQDMLPSNSLEDSGYLSLHRSQLSGHYDDSMTDHIPKRPLDPPSPHATTYRTSTPPAAKQSHASLSSSPRRVSPRSPPDEAAMKSASGSVTRRRRSSSSSSRRIKKHLLMTAATSPAEVRSVPAGVRNKENQDTAHPPHHNASQDMLPSSGLEDSGYLSLHRSQSGQCDDKTDHIQKQPLDLPSPHVTTYKASTPSSAEQSHASPRSSPRRVSPRSSPPRVSPRSSPPRVSPRSSPSRASRATTSLPIVRFQQAVCAELARNFQKNHRYDWSVVSRLAEEHLLDRVIGGWMGRDHVDVFSALMSRNLRGILGRILALLGDLDLISCRTVSKTWQKIILEDGTATGRILRVREHMDNCRPVRQVVPVPGLTRDFCLTREVLSGMQTLAASSSSSSPGFRSPQEPSPSSNQTRFNTFLQAASRLKQHEGLRCCRRCRSPARYNAPAQHAVCTRSSCQFDFCTLCQEAFHGALPCRTFQPPRTSTPGVPRSKITLRRL
ncbi:unnamed protein product [Merluccius merluccius]